MLDKTTDTYRRLIEAPKAIVFYTDIYSKHNLEKNQDTALTFVDLSTYDSLKNAYDLHQVHRVRTSIISGLALDWQKEGFRVFLMRHAELLELKPSSIENCGFILREYQDVLRLFLQGSFDPYWANTSGQ